MSTRKDVKLEGGVIALVTPQFQEQDGRMEGIGGCSGILISSYKSKV